jgi:hypothetical protein
MYCSGCGAEVPGELNYCNRCGMSLNAPANLPAPPAVPPTSFTRLALIIGLILILGMMIVFAGAGGLLRKGFAEPAVFLLAMFGLVTLFGTSIMLVRLWSKLSGLGAQPSPRPAQPNRQQSFPEPPRAARLPPRPANLGSVTENTTRTLDPVLRDSVEQEK